MKRLALKCLGGVGAVLLLAVGAGALMIYTFFGDNEPAVRSCEGGFKSAEWQADPKATGRAIAKCDWLDGRPVAEVVRVLGKPGFPPYRGYYSWYLGPSKNGIGPMGWDLTLRVKHGVVVESQAEERNV
jgi:hypothetical protein